MARDLRDSIGCRDRSHGSQEETVAEKRLACLRARAISRPVETQPRGRGAPRAYPGHRAPPTIYRTRFRSVPREVRSAVERTHDHPTLARWIEIFVARSAAEIAATVRKQ